MYNTNSNFIKTTKTRKPERQQVDAPKKGKKEDKHSWQRTDKRRAYE